MGSRNGPYKEDFPVGTIVRIASRPELEEFKATWQFHNPLKDEQLRFGGCTGKVTKVGFFHGGDELYELDGLPGIWHEACLRPNGHATYRICRRERGQEPTQSR